MNDSNSSNAASSPVPVAYNINLHVHRLAAWTASTAASSAKGKRFTVAQGVAMLEAVGLHRLVGSTDNLPAPDDVDATHRRWRQSTIEAAAALGLPFFTHGLAAKLINVYLKTVFVNPAYAADPRVMALHPPIDRELLDGLSRSRLGAAKTWRRLRDAAWSTYGTDTYQQAIDAMRVALPAGQGLWTTEEYWKGHQGPASAIADIASAAKTGSEMPHAHSPTVHEHTSQLNVPTD